MVLLSRKILQGISDLNSIFVTSDTNIRAIFEEEVRENRRGPALMEQVSGNVFKVKSLSLSESSHPILDANLSNSSTWQTDCQGSIILF